MKRLLLIPTFALSIVACNAGQNNSQTSEVAKPAPTQQSQSVATAKAPQKAQGVWIDVRSPEEYNAGHLEGAVNIVHTDIASQIASVAPDKNQPINLYCRSGRRAEMALQELKKLGYTNLTNHGAYDDLVKQGLK